MNQDSKFFVKYKGKIQGPFSVPDLKKLIKRGKINRAHLISEDRRSWEALGDVLNNLENSADEQNQDIPTPTGSSSSQASSGLSTPAGHNVETQQHQPAPTTTHVTLSPDTALSYLSDTFMLRTMIAGIVLVALVLMPASFIDYNRWLWSGWEFATSHFKFALIVGILAGAGAIVVSVTTKELTRSCAILGIAIFLYITALSGPKGSMLSAIAFELCKYTLPFAILLAALEWRRLGQLLLRRILVCVFGGLTALLCTYMVIDELVTIDFNSMNWLAGTGTLILFCGMGFGITAGILAVLQVKPVEDRSNSKLASTFAMIAPLCILTGAVLLFSSGWPDGADIITLIFMDFRILVAPLAVAMLAYCGTYELMLTCSTMNLRSPQKHGGIAPDQMGQMQQQEQHQQAPQFHPGHQLQQQGQPNYPQQQGQPNYPQQQGQPSYPQQQGQPSYPQQQGQPNYPQQQGQPNYPQQQGQPNHPQQQGQPNQPQQQGQPNQPQQQGQPNQPQQQGQPNQQPQQPPEQDIPIHEVPDQPQQQDQQNPNQPPDEQSPHKF